MDQTQEIVRAHRSMGTSYFSLGNPPKAIQELKAALRLSKSLDDPTRIAWLHHDLGVALRMMGNAEADQHFRQALEYWRYAHNAVGLASTLNSIGVGYHRQGKYVQAIETLEQAREQARQAGHLRWEAYALASLGDVYRDQNDYTRAQDTYRAAYDLAVRIGDGFIITFTLTALGELARLLGELETADSLLRQAVEQAESHQSSYELGLTKTALGILNCQRGNADAAINDLMHAAELLDRSDAKRDSARAHIHLAHAYFQGRKHRLAQQHLRITAERGKDLREDQFILSDGKRLQPVIKYSIAHRVGKDYFAPVLRKIKTLAPTPTHAPGVPTAEPRAPRLEVHAFGTAQVRLGGKLVTKTDWDSASAKELFLLLLAHPEGLRKEQIFSALWADTSPAQANGIFHSNAYRIRRAISPTILVYDNGLYRVNRVNCTSDFERFNQLIAEANNAATDAERVRAYRDAIALYRGDFFEDSYNEWCVLPRDELQKKYLAALLAVAEYYDQRGESDAIGFYQKILQRDPFREDIYGALIRFQLKYGDKTGALKTYQQCEQMLQTEMGVLPSPDIRALYEQ
ncbi:MAG: tetratricopeptide repeat protein, partial [Chloroflexota bacterium]